MTGGGQGPLFLARASYRQRRLRDTARMMPVLGVLLWAFPLLAGSEGMTSRIGLYIFGVWVLLIVVAAVIAARMKPDDISPDPASDPAD